jgi:predicted permease
VTGDFAHALRIWRKTPCVTAVTVAMLSIAIAAATLAFSLADALFLRPIPASNPEQLVRIYSSYAAGMQHFTVGFPDYVDIRNLKDIFSGVVAEQPAPFGVGLPGGTTRVWGEEVAGGYFSVLGIRPALGRFFDPREENVGGDEVVVIGDRLWDRAFGRDAKLLDRTILINGRPSRVIGVAAAEFHGTTPGLAPDLWRPARRDPFSNRGGRGFFVMGRLRPGVTVDRARTAVDLLARQLQQSYPDTNNGIRFAVLSEHESRIHPLLRESALGLSGTLIAVTGLLLLLTCANVAGMLLAGLLARRREMGVRLALGASPRRIARQLLSESAMLACAAGAVGVALSWIAARAVSAIQLPTRIPLSLDLTPDLRVLTFSFVITAAAVVLLGVLPALEAARVDVFTLTREHAGARNSSRIGAALIAFQVALALVLAVGGALFVRSLHDASRIDPGFESRGVVAAAVDLGIGGYSADQWTAVWRRLLLRVRSAPHVDSATIASTVPLEVNITRMSIGPQGYQATPQNGWPSIDWAAVGTDYFRTLRIPLLQGREFEDGDNGSSRPVAIVNDVVAEQFWRGLPAVRRIIVTADGRQYQVIGVVRRSKYLTIGESAKPFIYFSTGQDRTRAASIIVRGNTGSAEMLKQLRETIADVDPVLPIYNAAPSETYVRIALAPAIAGAGALTGVALIALVLTALGLYGAIARGVMRRAREIGIRRALGAQSHDIVGLVGGQAARPVSIGVAVGLPASYVAAHLVRRFLYSAQAADAAAIFFALLFLALVVIAANAAPTWRALRLQPSDALRRE